MSYPPKVTEKDRQVLEVIARGHPDRKMTATHRDTSSQVSALTWNEIQLALHASLSDISDCIARLVANDYVRSGHRSPSLWGRLKGESEATYFWITQKGLTFLHEGTDHVVISDRSAEKLSKVESDLKELGYDPTPYGVGVALLGLESGYSHAEAASHLALATLALDAKEAGDDIPKLMALLAHARAMLDILFEFKTSGLMREELFQSNAGTMLRVVIIDKDQPTWIERVLSDPTIGKERLATSRINYQNMIG